MALDRMLFAWISPSLPGWLIVVATLFCSGFANAEAFIPRLSVNANFTDDFIGPYVNLGGGYNILKDSSSYLCMQYGVGKHGKKGTLSYYVYDHYGFLGGMGFEIGMSAIENRAGSVAVEGGVTLENLRLNLVASPKKGVTLEIGAGF